MRIATTALFALALAAAGCQTTADQAATKQNVETPPTGTLTLTSLTVDAKLPAGKVYNLALPYESEGSPKVSKVCFFWSGEGPYCWAQFRVDGSAQVIRTGARTNNPGTYVLKGYVEYQADGTVKKSNAVEAKIEVN